MKVVVYCSVLALALGIAYVGMRAVGGADSQVVIHGLHPDRGDSRPSFRAASGTPSVYRVAISGEEPIPPTAPVDAPEDVRGRGLDSEAVPEYLEATGTPDEWTGELEGVGWREMQRQSDEIVLYVTDQASEELARRRANGIFEVISTDGSVSGLTAGPNRLVTGLDVVEIKYGGEVRRYQVPRAEYPELYALSDKAQWLHLHSSMKKAAER